MSSGGESIGNMTSDAARNRGLFSFRGSGNDCKIDRAVCEVERMEFGLSAIISLVLCGFCLRKWPENCGHELESLGISCKRHHVTKLSEGTIALIERKNKPCHCVCLSGFH